MLQISALQAAAAVGGALHCYCLPLPERLHASAPTEDLCSLTGNVDLPKPFHARADYPPAPGPVSDPGQEGEHEVPVELLLNSKKMHWILYYLVRWSGNTSADDEWLLAEELTHRKEQVAKYNAATTCLW